MSRPTAAKADEPEMRMTREEYLRFEAESLDRHEWYGGVVVTMTGGTDRHSRIIANTNGECRQRLKGSPCFVLESNMSVAVAAADRYVYPDGLIVCGQPAFAPEVGNETIIMNPRVVIEVLSPSTELLDRGGKFRGYLTLDTLREYVLISQAQPLVEVFARNEDGSWQFAHWEGVAAVARLRSVGIDLPLGEIYDGLTFPAPLDDDTGIVRRLNGP